MDEKRTSAEANNGRAAFSRRDAAEDVVRADRFDARLTAALHEVPVPAGLAERLLNRLQAEDSKSGQRALPVDIASALPPHDAPAPAGARAPVPYALRRRMFSLVALAASLLIAVTAVWVLRWRDSGPSDPAALAESWYAAITPKWRDAPAPKGFQVPDSIMARPQSWQWASKQVGSKAVVYDLSDQGGRAALFVVRMPPAGLQSSPLPPQSTTGGLTIGVWEQGGLRYALVVVGDERRYRGLINAAQPPLASLQLKFRLQAPLESRLQAVLVVPRTG
jgi:hypothetical protein